MRIDLVFPKFKRLSGAERLILSLGRALAARGHEVAIVCHRFDASCRPLLGGGVALRETGARLEWTGNHYLDSAVSYARAFTLRRFLAGDVVCLFGPALPLAWRSLPGRRLLYFCYEPPRALDIDQRDVLARVGALGVPLRWALAAYGAVDRWLVRRVDEVLVNGEFGRQRVRAAYGVEGRVVTHGLDLAETHETRAEARAALGLEPQAPTALTVNFLHPRKRVDLVLRAWVEVERRVPDCRLLVVGDGPEGPRLRVLASELGLRGAVFRGFVAEEDLPRCYVAADLLVHAARAESFGLTIVEAAGFALPAVVVDEGGPRWTVLHGETGLRVAAQPAALADAMAALLGDPARARALGARARENARRNFSWERGADDFLAACAARGVGE